ncbi:MAG: ABC transporter permease subunit [Pseudomonadota bacterium]|nr:MAG: ABC transporter permease subunit [Pseudomonadota bacterium]
MVEYASRITRRRRVRMASDTLARHGIAVGGLSVIIAIVLIFFYLLYVVVPLFRPAELEPVASYDLPAAQAGATLHLAMEEQNEVGARFTDAGHVIFFDTHDGQVIDEVRMALPLDTRVTSIASAAPHQATVALGLSNGHAIVVKHVYRVTFPGDRRLITPGLEYPMGGAPVPVDPEGKSLSALALQVGEEATTLVGLTADRRMVLSAYQREESFLDDSVSFTRATSQVPFEGAVATHLALDDDQRTLYVGADDGHVSYFDVSEPGAPALAQRFDVAGDSRISALRLLAGGISLVIGTEDGGLSQWFPVRGESGEQVVKRIREFDSLPGEVRRIAPEQIRKAFLAADASGNLSIYHATAHRTVLATRLADTALAGLTVSPRANAMLTEDAAGKLHFTRIHNEHPEVSWSSLWGKVWYESYEEPEYIWQSSSASNIFEPKFSLIPISFGTLKAAFYAMVIAVPLAILGAMFTAHFMSPHMRSVVKPSIEIMEALPTVILGFLAGLWLAPVLESNLPGIFAMLLLLPPGVLLAAWVWQRLPPAIRLAVPEGWEGALLIPAVLLIGYLSMAASPTLELWFFGGDMRVWLSTELGVDFDQRNSIVVGLAMGFAVIPTIFSITEDAIFAVPKHLVNGSLALGATPWQTMIRVVLLTASPGIFSAVMIGLGRAVGETMIVLMATGNTPVMDFSIFQGMRTLSANIAVEMPESEVDSTHYRVLFLAGLVLFAFTFAVNTVAELVRQRLRRRYSTL